ncbi:MAG: hypothetical protein JSS02_01700 [Planctomycetes bacterium]|nr:hypothetical protein [Planctomycetota bacterium]
MPRPRKPLPVEPAENQNQPAAAVERLADEMRALQEVLDSIREDFSWVTRNGLPVQPVEHVIVKRMAKNRLAGDWAEQLELIRVQNPQRSEQPNLDAIEQLVAGLRSAFDLISQGQLGLVLTALDGVRDETLAVVGRTPSVDATVIEPDQPGEPKPVPPPGASPSSPVKQSAPVPRPNRARLF